MEKINNEVGTLSGKEMEYLLPTINSIRIVCENALTKAPVESYSADIREAFDRDLRESALTLTEALRADDEGLSDWLNGFVDCWTTLKFRSEANKPIRNFYFTRGCFYFGIE